MSESIADLKNFIRDLLQLRKWIKILLRIQKYQILPEHFDEHFDEHFPCRNAIFDPLWNLQTVSPSIKTLIFLKIWSVVAHTVPGMPIKSQHLAPNHCQTIVENHQKKHVFHAIFDPRGATLELFFEGFPMSFDKTERLNRKRINFYIGLCGVTFFSDPKSRCATSFWKSSPKVV